MKYCSYAYVCLVCTYLCQDFGFIFFIIMMIMLYFILTHTQIYTHKHISPFKLKFFSLPTLTFTHVHTFAYIYRYVHQNHLIFHELQIHDKKYIYIYIMYMSGGCFHHTVTVFINFFPHEREFFFAAVL